MSKYAADEMRAQLRRGPFPGDDFFRMKVTGSGETRWVNVTPEQVEAFAATLEREDAEYAAPFITFDDSGSYYAFFREADGWVVSLKYRHTYRGIAPAYPANVMVVAVEDDGLHVQAMNDGEVDKSVTWTVGFNDIDAMQVR